MSLNIKAQQDPQYSHYMFNSLVINPAYAGYKENINVSAIYRAQWVSIPGAPRTQSVIADGSFYDDKVGLGISIVNDRIGLQGQLSFYGNYAYRLKIEDDGILALGLGVGVAQYSLNGDDATIQDPSDPNYAAGKVSYFVPDARFGVHYSNQKWYAGLSSTNLFSKSINYNNNTKNLVATQGRHYFLTAGYLFEVNDFLKIKPSFLFKEDTKGPTNLDLTAFFLLKDRIRLGTSYRTGLRLWNKSNLSKDLSYANAIVGLVEYYTEKGWRIGYSYDYSVSSLNSVEKGSHEISLGYILNSKKLRVLTPRYF